jgi:hypothetical protein
VSRAFEYSFTSLRISQAFVSLQCQPESGGKAVSLAWIGDLEIRMHAAPPAGVTERPLFILDIFDHDTQRFIDSRACYTLADGSAAFDDFLLMAEPAAGGPH